MHSWGDEDVDWKGINDAAGYIALWLRRWPRVGVRDFKEKYGTIRIYCSLGWGSIHEIWKPGYVFNQYPFKWMRTLDVYLGRKIMHWLNFVVIPVHKQLYRWRYKKAVKKWGHLRTEILCAADFPELLKGL